MMQARNRRSAPVRFGSLAVRPPLVLPGMRIGLLGGSFNPPHEGHLLITETAKRRLGLDRVWWIVTPGNPLKERSGLASQDARMRACRGLARHPWIEVTGFEADLPSAYTAATLDFLRLRHPRVRFVWLMGADNLRSFHRWQHWRKIAATMPIAIVDRPRHRLRAMASPAARSLVDAFVPERNAARLAEMHPPAWCVLTGRLSPLSSTELRARGLALE